MAPKRLTDPEICGVPIDMMRTSEAGNSSLMSRAATTAPSSWASTYQPSRVASILPASQSDRLTAGLMCPPEMGIMIVIAMPSAKACASATPTAPPAPPAALVTTLPAPRKTKSAVPTNSAIGARS